MRCPSKHWYQCARRKTYLTKELRNYEDDPCEKQVCMIFMYDVSALPTALSL
jgi:hypothetical protein